MMRNYEKVDFEPRVGKGLCDKIAEGVIFKGLNGKVIDGTFFAQKLLNFDNYREKNDLRDVIEELYLYYSIAFDIIEKWNGHIIDIDYDVIYAVWGVLDTNNYTQSAYNAAMECLEKLNNQSNQIRIGLATGKIVIGNFGNEQRFFFKAIGRVVDDAIGFMNNLTSTSIMACEQTINNVKL